MHIFSGLCWVSNYNEMNESLPGEGALVLIQYCQRPHVANRGKAHTSHLLLQGGVLGLQPQQFSIRRAGCRVGCGSSHFLQAAVLLLQLLDLRAQLQEEK